MAVRDGGQGHYSYLARSPNRVYLGDLGYIHGIVKYTYDMKVDSNIAGNHLLVQIIDSPDALGMVESLANHGQILNWENGGKTSVAEIMAHSSPEEIAESEDVLWVSRFYESEEQVQQSETETEIIGGGWSPLTPYGGPGSMVNLAGWNGSGVTISLCDGGIGDGIPGSGHEDFGARFVGGIQYVNGVGIYYPTGNIAGDGNSHGTHCCGCFGADGSRGTGLTYPNTGYYVGMGSAPDCTIFDQRIFSGSWGGPDTIPQWQGLFQDSYDNDVDICSFSWGTSNAFGYDYQCVAFDAAIRDSSLSTPGDQQLIIFKSAGNDGTKGIVSPGWAKNIVLVGGTQNYYPDGTSYGCPQNRNNIDAMYPNSARGPTGDNRIKPDVMAPADYTLSTRSSATTDDGAGLYTPDTLDRYNWNIGTSFSGPYGAGTGGCVFEWYNATRGAEPSPAMVRACLINCAVDISGSAGGIGDIPNYDEGWGRIYLPNILMPSVNVMTEDADPAFPERFLETGDTYGVPTFVKYDDPSKPMKITLTWVDPAAAEGAAIHLINNLNLKVTAPDGTTAYYGNAFSGGYSQAGMASPWDYEGATNFDSRNNVECIYIAPGSLQAGLYTVEVIGENIPVDAVAGTPEVDQDFALVIYNGLPGILPDEPQFDGLARIVNPGTGNSLSLEWLAGDDYDEEFPLTYYIYRDTAPGLPGRIVPGVSTPHATYSPAGLSPGDPISWQDTISITEGLTYYYWVVARDAGGLAPTTSPLFENPANTVELSGVPEALVFFQVQSPAAGYRYLNQDPFETAVQTGNTQVMEEIGEYQIDAVNGKWLSDALPYDSDLNGTWRFSIHGKMNNVRANGYLYAKVCRHSDSSTLFTTGYDNEDIAGFTGGYHQFLWEHTVSPGTLNLPVGDRFYVELWAHVINVTNVVNENDIIYDFSTGAGTDRWYYDTSWTSNPPTGYTAQAFETVLPSASGAYADIATAGGTATAGIDAGGSGNRWAASKVVTTLAEAPGGILSVEMRFQGAGEGVAQETSIKQIYAWNYGTASWLYISEGTLPRWTALGSLAGTLSASTPGFTSWNDFMDASNQFTWLLFDTSPDPSNRQTRLHCDYVKTTVSAALEPLPPDGQFTFAYDTDATPSAIHPEIPNSGEGGATPQAYSINLNGKSGWVLVSFPIAISGNIATILNDAQTTWNVAKWYDGHAKAWKTYRHTGTQTFTIINNQMGVWLHLTANAGDQMLTTTATGYYPSSAVNIQLYAGWNLVGYPSATSRTLTDAFDGTNADMAAVYSSTTPWILDIALPSLDMMSHGNGYWIRVPADVIWSVGT